MKRRCKSKNKREYKKQLKDVRWRRLRQKVIDRDEGKCVLCWDTEKLHVHHMKYTGAVWEAPMKDLITLCEGCHNELHRDIAKKIVPKSYNPLDDEDDIKETPPLPKTVYVNGKKRVYTR